MQGGKDLVAMLNTFGSSTPILFVVFVETIGVFWFYGVSRWAPVVSAQNTDRTGLVCAAGSVTTWSR